MICNPWPLARLPAVALPKKSKKRASSNPQPLAASAPMVKLASRTQVNRQSQLRTPPISSGSEVVGAATIAPVGA